MRIKQALRLGVLLATVTALLPAAAQAYNGPVWSVGEKEVGETAKAVKSKDVSDLTFEDTKLSVSVKCKVTAEGKVESEGAGEINLVEVSGCESVLGCTGTIVAKALHTPWKTQLEEVEGKLRSAVASSSGPGWSVECTVSGVLFKDECTGETTTGIENVLGGTDLLFDSKSAHLKCTVGGENAGVVTGTELDESPAEGLLQANPPPEASNGVEILGPTKPLLFPGAGAFKIVLANLAGIMITWENGVQDIPGEATPLAGNFSLSAVAGKPCGLALNGGASCEINIISAAAGFLGMYILLYTFGFFSRELKFELVS